MDFGDVIKEMKAYPEKRFARKGWNGRGIYIQLLVPDRQDRMTHPYIYIDTTGLQSDNPDAPRDLVPWLASQTDMLAEDWIEAESQKEEYRILDNGETIIFRISENPPISSSGLRDFYDILTRWEDVRW